MLSLSRYRKTDTAQLARKSQPLQKYREKARLVQVAITDDE
jgi:hypothetical protein